MLERVGKVFWITPNYTIARKHAGKSRKGVLEYTKLCKAEKQNSKRGVLNYTDGK